MTATQDSTGAVEKQGRAPTDTTQPSLSLQCSPLLSKQEQILICFISRLPITACCAAFTHSSESRSFSNLFLSLKQPRECMLSRTSGSMSSAEGRLRMVTFLGTGCSGSGSFLPPLLIQKNTTTQISTTPTSLVAATVIFGYEN